MSTHYTPQLDEFYQGFEYEQYNPHNPKEWTKKKFDFTEADFLSNTYKLERQKEYVRVKLLDFYDLKEIGFNRGKVSHQFTTENHYVSVVEGDNFDIIGADENIIAIFDIGSKNRLFRGKVKNKSEFFKVLKLIGIHEHL